MSSINTMSSSRQSCLSWRQMRCPSFNSWSFLWRLTQQSINLVVPTDNNKTLIFFRNFHLNMKRNKSTKVFRDSILASISPMWKCAWSTFLSTMWDLNTEAQVNIAHILTHQSIKTIINFVGRPSNAYNSYTSNYLCNMFCVFLKQ